MGLLRRGRFVRTRAGDYRVRLDADERELLATLPDQLEGLLNAGGPEAGDLGMVRLFPPAYLEDASCEAEYRALMRDELVRRRLESVATLRATLVADQLTDAELYAWVRVLNDVRLILGTILDVSEDTDVLDVASTAGDAPQRVVYYVLSGLVDEAVTALAGGLAAPPLPS